MCAQPDIPVDDAESPAGSSGEVDFMVLLHRQIHDGKLRDRDLVALKNLIGVHERSIIRQFVEEEAGEGRASSTLERLSLLDRSMALSPSTRPSDLVREIFPEIAAAEERELLPPLPEKAPQVWKNDRLPGEDAPSFIKRVYGPWIGKGLGRADIRRFDVRLYEAMYIYTRTHSWPEDVPLPTVRERNDQRLSELGEALVGTRDLYRLAGAAARRAAQR